MSKRKRKNDKSDVKLEDNNNNNANNSKVDDESNKKKKVRVSKKMNLSEPVPIIIKKSNQAMIIAEIHDDKLNLSGDTGIVGRIKLPKSSNNVAIDLKGRLYAGTVQSSASILLLDMHGQEARIEGVSNEFVAMKYIESIHDAEHLEGELNEKEFEDLDANVND